MALTTWDEQQQYRDYLASLAYNGARDARSLHRIASKGTGETHIAKPVAFATTFVQEPTFTSGLSMLAGTLISGAYPIASVGVYKWQTDRRNFYIGAYIWVAVTFGTTELNAQNKEQAAARISLSEYRASQLALLRGEKSLLQAMSAVKQAQALNAIQLNHHLVFEGLALRDVDPNAVLDD